MIRPKATSGSGFEKLDADPIKNRQITYPAIIQIMGQAMILHCLIFLPEPT